MLNVTFTGLLGRPTTWLGNEIDLGRALSVAATGLGEEVGVAVTAGVAVTLAVGVAAGVGVGVASMVAVGVAAGVPVAVAVGVPVAVAVAPDRPPGNKPNTASRVCVPT